MLRAALLRQLAEQHRQQAASHAATAETFLALAAIEARDDATEYTTAPGGPLPPRRTHRWFRDHAPKMPGARREGGKRGRSVVWVVPRDGHDAFEALLKTRGTPPAEDAGSSASSAVNVIDIDRWIANGGYRLTKKAAR